ARRGTRRHGTLGDRELARLHPSRPPYGQARSGVTPPCSSPYCYTGAQPHTLTGTSTTADCTNPGRDYAYDPAGNTTQRPGQTLTWNTEGKLAQVTEDVVDTHYLYDASGNLLIRHTEGGERVLYAGDTELHLRADGTMWAQRYYGTPDMTLAVRSNRDNANDQSVSSLAGDKHRTSTIAVDVSEEQSFVKRAFTPFGEQRTEASIGNWIDDKAFIGKTHDKATGLTHIGAREYDPTTGTFLSADPVLQTGVSQTLNGYSYARQNPYTYTDPTGERLACGGEGSDTKCPERPDGTEGNGRPQEAVDFSKPAPHHPCNGPSCKGGGGTQGPTETKSKIEEVLQDGETLKKMAAIAAKIIAVGGIDDYAAQRFYKAMAKPIGSVRTVGMCGTLSGGEVIGGSFSSCVVVTRVSDGDFVLARSQSVGVATMTAGGSVSITLLASNADDPSQLHGHGFDFGLSAAWGSGVTTDLEFGIGSETSEGNQVWAAQGGYEYGAEVEGSVGYNYTGEDGMVGDAMSELLAR
ncbi:RHS repeat-associated core domain-containing protein, partial [Streptomyces sp. TR02-1]|uniref:RHS repeat-associated core domain-containing protein n=1 Tax=Streptomyces sp. TR02-1 TaxID=3385977 RepID=UPI0039A04347